MRCETSMGNTRIRFLAGAVLMCLASTAFAQSATFVGGGATLPQIAYTGSNATTKNTPVTGSMFKSFSNISGNPLVTYCPTGSGTGRTVLENNVPATSVNVACGSGGFGGTGLTQPQFAASDTPLAPADLTNYAAGHSGVANAAPVQFPSVSGAIAVSFHKTGVTTLNLTENQVCQIYSGQIKTWDALAAVSATGVPAGTTGNITIVYRGDSSGTSFNFSNHLSAMCGSAKTGDLGIAGNFKTDSTFANAIASYLSAFAASDGTATGNAGVVNKAASIDGAIGYAEVANVVAGTTTKYAKVSNKATPTTFVDPSSYGGTILPVALTYDSGINGVDANGRPVIQALTTTAKCIALVNPDNYARPASGYPIVAVTYLLGNAGGNGADAAAARRLLGSPYNATVRTNTFTVGASSGFSWLSNADLVQSKFDGCVLN